MQNWHLKTHVTLAIALLMCTLFHELEFRSNILEHAWRDSIIDFYAYPYNELVN